MARATLLYAIMRTTCPSCPLPCPHQCPCSAAPARLPLPGCSCPGHCLPLRRNLGSPVHGDYARTWDTCRTSFPGGIDIYAAPHHPLCSSLSLPSPPTSPPTPRVGQFKSIVGTISQMLFFSESIRKSLPSPHLCFVKKSLHL